MEPMLIRILSILFPLFAITALGFFVARRMKPDLSHANRLNLAVFVPALVFGAMAGKDFRLTDYLPLLLAGFGVIVVSGLFGWLAARALGIAPRTLVPPMMFNNCGNLGLPLAVLAFGDAALAPAVVLFVLSNLLHFSFGAWLLDPRTSWLTAWQSPSVLATGAGLAVGMSGIEVWAPLLTAIRMVGDISIPLMLFALGVRMVDVSLAGWRVGLLGAVLCPLTGLAGAALALPLLQLAPEQTALVVLFGALPPAVLNYMFAERYGQEPDKVASMVLIGNLAAVVFLPVALALTLR